MHSCTSKILRCCSCERADAAAACERADAAAAWKHTHCMWDVAHLYLSAAVGQCFLQSLANSWLVHGSD